MSNIIIAADTTSKILEIMVRDSSTGLGKTGIAYSDVTASYCREGSTRTAIELTEGTAGAAYSSGKWAEVDATNMRGLYQLHVPNATLAAGVDRVTMTIQVTGAIDVSVSILLNVSSESTVATALLASVLANTTTVSQALRLAAAAGGGKLSGAGTSTESLYDAQDDTSRVVVATTDENGNRTPSSYFPDDA